MTESFLKFKDLINQTSIFWFCALLGSGLFIVQFLLSLFGDTDQEDFTSVESDAFRIKWLSKQAITGFLMMFGWSALACHDQFNLPISATWIIALTAGIIAVIVNGFIFKMARKLHSPGNIFRLEDALGKEATVYQRIPKGGTGKITLSLHQLTHEIEAISLNDEELPSFTPVLIVKKANENTLIVTQSNR